MREGGDLEQGVAGDVGQVGRIGIYFRGRISGTYCCNLLSKTLGVLKCVELNCVDVSSMPCQPVGKKPVAEATLWFAWGTDPHLMIDAEGTAGFDL